MAVEKKVTERIIIYNARLVFRNFTGRKDDYNTTGERSFGILLDPEMAEDLAAKGWYIRTLRARPDHPEDADQPWLKVKVRFDQYPPKADAITSRGRTKLDSETIGQLDWARLKNVDVKISPYNYPAFLNRPAGVAAYLDAIYATIQEDELEMKYADLAYIGGGEEEEMPFG